MNCAVYIRKSRQETGKESHRLTVQRQQLPDHARAQGWACEIYDDGHASAARGKTEDLAQRARLEADITAGKINIILCIELSRLSRDDSLQDYVAWLHLCGQHKVKLATLSRILDPGQHSDWMLLLMEGGFSSVEMRVLQSRMKEGRAEAYRAGKYLAGNPPIPYLYDPATSRLIIDETQLPGFRQMMKLAETDSAKQVARKTGLAHISVRRAIADQRLIMYQGLRIDPDTGKIIPGQWPAVITPEQAVRVQQNRINKISGYSRRHAASLLSNLGLLMCGYCGKPIRASRAGRLRKDGTYLHYYGCPGKESRTCSGSRMIPQSEIDERIIMHLLGTLSDIAHLRHCWQAQQTNGDHAQELADINQQQTALQQKKQRLVAAIAEGIIDFADAKTQRQSIQQQLDAIITRREIITASIITEPNWDTLQITAADWQVLTATEHRALLATLLANIKMYSQYLTVQYHIPRTTDGNPAARINLPPPQRPKAKNVKKPGV